MTAIDSLNTRWILIALAIGLIVGYLLAPRQVVAGNLLINQSKLEL
ncbi:MAG: hypothetical protein MUF87_21310 [Anaerolineae bacterium]|jgi:hypothetical protein|nr:hypothetical protein [Anaerolineae bacterium]